MGCFWSEADVDFGRAQNRILSVRAGPNRFDLTFLYVHKPPTDGSKRGRRSVFDEAGAGILSGVADELIFQPPFQLRERHHDVGAVGGAFGKRAVPALDVGHLRPSDIEAEVAVE